MVTIEDIEQTEREIEEIKRQIPKCQINEEHHFNFIEEICKYYNAETLDEFEKKFRSGN